ncbi:MAG: GGDEF domain-containing protein [Desulfovibrionaceae bacterium]|nr:GGDEF domain-containing protein [Desulfovibrionaceae bacterium]
MKMNKNKQNDIFLHTWYRENKDAYDVLFQSIEHVYQDIAEVDIDNESIFILRNSRNENQEGNSYPYTFEADQFCDYYIMMEDSKIAKDTLAICNLRRFYESGQKSSVVELRVCAKDTVYEWIELCTFVMPKNKTDARKILITVRSINNQKLMKGIIDRFIYDACDYFIYLDAQKDSYVMFSGSDNGTPLPPTTCNSYSTEIIRYAYDFVVKEDQNDTIEQMSIPVVLEQLDKHGVHTFYTGVMDPIRGYTRKCLKYLYYDKKNQMILLIRTDVTDVYLEEKKKNDQLRQALKEARTDLLTGLYNRAALEISIGQMLRDQHKITSGSFFFIDIDNFKLINDQYGHNHGDYVLCYLSEKLQDITPKSCIIGRFGGDEFIVFYPNFKSTDCLKQLAAKICSIFDTVDTDKFRELNCSCSVGISLYPQAGASYDELSQKADTMLYDAKRKGKKQFCFMESI